LLGVAVGILIFRSSLARSSVLVSVLAALVAVVIAVLMLWR
jgi:hypothetical protein